MKSSSIDTDTIDQENFLDDDLVYSPYNTIPSESMDDSCEPKIRVLVLESSDALLELIKNEIEKDKNIKVVGMARNPHEARNMVMALDPDLLIMDILDPHSGGLEFLERLNRFSPRPVLLLTSLSKMPSQLALSAFKAGATDFIDKDTLLLLDSSPLSKGFFLIDKIKAIANN